MYFRNNFNNKVFYLITGYSFHWEWKEWLLGRKTRWNKQTKRHFPILRDSVLSRETDLKIEHHTLVGETQSQLAFWAHSSHLPVKCGFTVLSIKFIQKLFEYQLCAWHSATHSGKGGRDSKHSLPLQRLQLPDLTCSDLALGIFMWETRETVESCLTWMFD